MTQFSYNGVDLPYANITQFKQQPILDESNTDWFCTEYDITVQSLVNVNYLQITSTGPGSDHIPLNNPADIMVVLRGLLMRQRRLLSVLIDGNQLIPIPQEGNIGYVDAQNGPHPKYCNIIFMSNTTFLIEFRVVARYWENNSYKLRDGGFFNRSNTQGGVILYNRWSESSEIDELGFTTRTRKGKYVIRSDNKSKFLVDKLRYSMAQLSIGSKFIRKAQSYKVSPDGLSLEYSVTDHQIYRVYPPTIKQAAGYYTEQTAGVPTTNLRIGEAYIKLSAGPDVATSFVASVAMFLVHSLIVRRGIIASIKGTGSINLILSSSIRLGVYDNSAEARMKVQIVAGDKEATIYNVMAYSGIDNFLPVLPGPPYLNPASGTNTGIPLLLLAASYYDPNVPSTGLSIATNQLSPPGLSPGEAGIIVEL